MLEERENTTLVVHIIWIIKHKEKENKSMGFMHPHPTKWFDERKKITF